MYLYIHCMCMFVITIYCLWSLLLLWLFVTVDLIIIVCCSVSRVFCLFVHLYWLFLFTWAFLIVYYYYLSLFGSFPFFVSCMYLFIVSIIIIYSIYMLLYHCFCILPETSVAVEWTIEKWIMLQKLFNTFLWIFWYFFPLHKPLTVGILCQWCEFKLTTSSVLCEGNSKSLVPLFQD